MNVERGWRSEWVSVCLCCKVGSMSGVDSRGTCRESSCICRRLRSSIDSVLFTVGRRAPMQAGRQAGRHCRRASTHRMQMTVHWASKSSYSARNGNVHQHIAYIRSVCAALSAEVLDRSPCTKMYTFYGNQPYYYISFGSTVNLCVIDVSKAFDLLANYDRSRDTNHAH